MQTFHDNREAWAQAAVEEFRALIHEATGLDVPLVRVGIGFPSAGLRSNVIGECWAPAASADGHHEIFIRPDRMVTAEQRQGVLDVLLHEVCHAVAGIPAKHGPAFKRVATAVGLEGPMTATEPSAEMREAFLGWVAYGSLGRYPMGQFNPSGLGTPRRPADPGTPGDPKRSGPPTQGTRMLKAACASHNDAGETGCGYTVRLTRKWAEVAMPNCPNPDCDRSGLPLTLE